MVNPTPDQIRERLVQLGWAARRGSSRLHGALGLRQYRIVMQVRSVRVEGYTAGGTWLRVAGGFMSDCALLPDGRVRLGSMIFGKPA